MIKEIDKIPESKWKSSQREMIRQDIEYAFKNRIPVFEFEGNYNWKYLASYAREEADYYARWNIVRPNAVKARATLRTEFPDAKYVRVESEFRYKNKLIKISEHKAEDRIHVYGQIDFAAVDNFYETFLADSRKLYDERSNRDG